MLCYAKSLQSYPTLYDSIDGSPPGSPVPEILQARTLEWVAVSFSNAWKWKVKVKLLSHVRLLATPWTAAYQAPPSMGFSRQEYWSGVPLQVLIVYYSKKQRKRYSHILENANRSTHKCMYAQSCHCSFGLSFSFERCWTSFPEKAMAPHSSTLAWKIPWMEEPGRLQSMGSWRVGHD